MPRKHDARVEHKAGAPAVGEVWRARCDICHWVGPWVKRVRATWMANGHAEATSLREGKRERSQ